MKSCIKKIYCTSCKRLVQASEEASRNNVTRVSCSRCGRLLYLWNGATWSYVRHV